MSIINHTHRFVFVHVPKNAGTSISTLLSPLTTYRDQEIGATPMGEAVQAHYQRRFGLSKHSSAREIAAVMGDEFAEYFVFASVRSPFDRIRSLFVFLQRWPGWRTLPGYAPFVESFDTIGDASDFVRSPIFQTTGPDRMFRPQVDWLVDATGTELLPQLLLRVETLRADFGTLVGMLALPVTDRPSTRRRLNASGTTRQVFDSDAKRIIRARYARDFELLQYDVEDI